MRCLIFRSGPVRGLLVALLATVCVGGAGAVDLFQDATVAKGISGAWFHDGVQSDYAGVRGGGAAVFDYDRDGDEDLYVTHNDDRANQLFRNDLGAGFVDVAAQAGVASTTRSLGTLAADLDNDGDSDLLVLNEGANILYRNVGNGTFVDVTAASGLLAGNVKACYGAAVADYDLDGDLDVYLSNWHFTNHVLSANELWRNDGGLTFVDVTGTALVGDDRETLVSIWHDLDVDGDPDLISVNEFEPDRVFENDGDGTFSLVTYDWLAPSSNVDAGLGMGVHIADVDLDGLQDIYVTNFWKNNLYMNDGDGTWTDRAVETGSSGPTQISWIGWGVEMFDAELDGDLDIYVVNGHMSNGTPNDLYINDGTGNFVVAANGGGASHGYISRGAVLADFDLDGDQDIFVVNHNTPEEPGDSCYYENLNATQNHWLRLRTRGIVSNAEGVGARVTVTAGATSWVREVTIGSSFASSSSAYLVFGLGSATSVDVRVQWPSGTVDDIPGVGVDQTVVIVEGQDSVVGVGDAHAPLRPQLAAVPNPARRSSAISFALAGDTGVSLGAYTIDGRRVRSIHDGMLAAGAHTLTWDGRADDGTDAAPGVYYLRLFEGGRATTARLVKID